MFENLEARSRSLGISKILAGWLRSKSKWRAVAAAVLFGLACWLPVRFFVLFVLAVLLGERLAPTLLALTFTLILSWPFYELAVFMGRSWKRFNAPSLEEILQTTNGKAVLYLRPFRADRRTMRLDSRWTQFLWFFAGGIFKIARHLWGVPLLRRTEELVIEPFQEIGPVLAIGRPREQNSPRGAIRIYPPHKDWKRAVELLLNEAILVVMYAGTSPAFRWELNCVFHHEPFVSVVIIVPPRMHKSHELAQYFREVLQAEAGVQASEWLGSSRLLYFRSRTEIDYLAEGTSEQATTLTRINPYLDPILQMVEPISPGSTEAFLTEAGLQVEATRRLTWTVASIFVGSIVLGIIGSVLRSISAAP